MSNVLHTSLSPERQRVLELHRKGLTPRDIANVTGLSTQRIYKQLKKLGETPNQKSDGQAS